MKMTSHLQLIEEWPSHEQFVPILVLQQLQLRNLGTPDLHFRDGSK
jgi:hypothetical protein